jgi:cobalt-zinc-cadmium efflux system membrane fusion protein
MRDARAIGLVLAALSALLPLGGCGGGQADAAAGAPPPAVVDHETGDSVFHVDKPDRFPLVAAIARQTAPTLTVTGVVNPDVSRAVPVVSLASGRVVDLRVRLGDHVTKGQLLMRIQSADATSAIADHRKAQADETLAHTQLDRARELFERGAIAKKDLEVAQDTADKATVDLQNTAEHLRVLGVAADDGVTAGSVVSIVAPASGVITEQNVTAAAGVKTLDNSPNLLTISDLSRVWILCDVNENDLPSVRVGDHAEIRVDGYPGRVLDGRIGNIGEILDPTLRTAKVRVELPNPGLLRVGMFVTATFQGQQKETRVAVPASAVLHLHDRDWVYVATGADRFERRLVVAGPLLPGNLQEIVSGLDAGQRVVANALLLQSTVEQ